MLNRFIRDLVLRDLALKLKGALTLFEITEFTELEPEIIDPPVQFPMFVGVLLQLFCLILPVVEFGGTEEQVVLSLFTKNYNKICIICINYCKTKTL